ncbi:MAG: hypothetical protein ACOVP5_08060 [Chitinophagales bacterium]
MKNLCYFLTLSVFIYSIGCTKDKTVETKIDLRDSIIGIRNVKAMQWTREPGGSYPRDSNITTVEISKYGLKGITIRTDFHTENFDSIDSIPIIGKSYYFPDPRTTQRHIILNEISKEYLFIHHGEFIIGTRRYLWYTYEQIY